MSHFIELSEIKAKEVFQGLEGKMIHGKQMTVAHFQIKAGSILPEHSHPHEQMTNIISGEMEFRIGDETKLCKAGDICMIPSHVVHSGRALTDLYVIDVFSPVREDYR